MKRLCGILVCSLVFLCLVQACGALTYEGKIDTTPTQVNALKPGDEVSEVTGVIVLPSSGDETFNADDDVDFYTQLDDARWSVAIVIGGIENPARTFAGKHATIGGYDLSYPSSDYDNVKLRFTMTGGKVPASFTSGNIILVRAQELDPDSRLVGAPVYVNGTVISTEALQANASQVLDDITALKAEIDAQAASGVDVTLPLQHYETARQALQTAKSYLSSAPEKVQAQIDIATSNIAGGRTSLDRASAEYSIDSAKTQLQSVDGLINEFTVNRSIKTTDSRLVGIINKRDLAAQSISSANDFFTSGNYLSAEGKAGEGLTLAIQAWNLSVDLKTELDKGFSLPGIPNLSGLLPFFLVAAVILIIAGVLIYRKKMHWDELG